MYKLLGYETKSFKDKDGEIIKYTVGYFGEPIKDTYGTGLSVFNATIVRTDLDDLFVDCFYNLNKETSYINGKYKVKVSNLSIIE